MKKRLLSAIVTLCMLLTMVPTVAFAADNTDDVEYQIQESNYLSTFGKLTVQNSAHEGDEVSLQWESDDYQIVNFDLVNKDTEAVISAFTGAETKFTMPAANIVITASLYKNDQSSNTTYFYPNEYGNFGSASCYLQTFASNAVFVEGTKKINSNTFGKIWNPTYWQGWSSAGMFTTLKFPEGLEIIAKNNFAIVWGDAKLQRDKVIVFPSTLKTIDANAFARNQGNYLLNEGIETIGDNAFETNKTNIVFVPNDTVQDKLTGKYNAAYTIVANLQGGTLADDTVIDYENPGTLPTPVKEGFAFDGWYTNPEFSAESKVDGTVQKQSNKYPTCYAKWRKSATLTTNIGEQKFVVGTPTEFTFTTTANDDAGTMVIGTSNFSDADAIDKLEYLESKDGKWYELKGDFGPSTGFPMSNATSKFRVTFKKGGNYTFTASMKKVDGGDVLCSTEVEFTVEKKTQDAPAVPTMKDRTYTSITLNEIADSENGTKAEYSKDGGKTWKASPEFTDLTAGTTYTFAVRYAETDAYKASEIATTDFATLRHSSGSSSGSTTTTNTVSASTASNGKVSLDKSTAKKGDTVTVTVTPDAGYELSGLTVKDAKGNTLTVTDKDNGKYTFTMPDGKVTVVPTFTKVADENPSNTGYTDVADKDWYADAVAYVTNKGLMSGTGDNKFSPNSSTTRGMLMTVLARYAGADTTNSTPWYQAGMDWAKANGVSDGTNPTVNITREQLVTMLYRYAGSPAANGNLDSFADASTVSSYAVNAMQWAVRNGIVNGSNGKLNPKNNATRAEVAAILMRYCEMGK